MPTFLLPRLSEDVIFAPIQYGQWEQAGVTERFLKGLADGLSVAANNNKIDSIDSIPDIWARPIFFQMALYAGLDTTNQNFDSNLHEKVKGEWRSILAMLALQGKRHLRLTAEEVHLSQSNEVGSLGRMLLTLAPKDSVTGQKYNSDWSDIYVISYNGMLLAITSPTTLIATAADYSKTLAGNLMQPWSSNGQYLTDPIPYLSLDELSGLYFWLQELENNLRQTISLQVQQNNETCRQLFKALGNYMFDVQNRVSGVFTTTGNIVPAGLNMHIGIFRFLDKKVQAPTSDAKDSAVLIRTSKARSKAKPLLLVSPQMLNELSVSRGIPLSQLVVWSGLTAVNITEKSLTGDRNMIDGVSLKNAEWRRPEEFFTERLVFHEGGDALVSVLKVRGSETLSQEDLSVILPLKQEILDYFEPKEIIKNFYIERIGNEIKVQFTFPLSGVNGVEIEYKVEKSYPVKEVIYLMSNIPAIEIWPNFKRQGWKNYYLYYENSEAQNQVEEASGGFFYIYPWAYGKNIAGDTPNHGLANLYTAKLSGFPEALICTVNSTEDGGVHAQTVEAGLLLLSEPKSTPIQMGKTWQVGIDFGTSSTMIYYRNGKNEPKPLDLQPNLFQVTNSGDLRNRTYRNFIPSSIKNQQKGSFLSIFQLLKNNTKGEDIRPLQDGNVFWLLSAYGLDAEDFRNNSSRIDANLKWQDDQLGRLKVAAYIKQICLQCLAEAAQNEVGEISWNFSYPTAFSAFQQMTFNDTCRVAVNETLKNAGFVLGRVDFWSESKASAYYFSQLGGNKLAGGAICLDIGAGTTDISVISGQPARIVYHTSLQFAGRYLFRALYKHYDIFAKKSIDFGSIEAEQRDALIDADMRENSQDYLNNLRNMTGRDDVQNVLQIAQFAVAGIFYYLGGLIGLLHDAGIYNENNVPEVYIGGNGSRIFSWICGNTFIDDNPYISVFKDMLVATSNLSLDYGFRLVLSDTPKVEVACGMVEDQPPNHNTFFDAHKIARELFGDKGDDLLIADSVFAGDNFILSNKTHQKTEFISAYDIKDGIRIQNVNELQNFVKKFNANQYIWGRKYRIKISDEQLARISRAILGVYSQQVGRDVNDIFVEPVFILELKKFMEML